MIVITQMETFAKLIICQSKERDLNTAPEKCTSAQKPICKVDFKGFLFLIFNKT